MSLKIDFEVVSEKSQEQISLGGGVAERGRAPRPQKYNEIDSSRVHIYILKLLPQISYFNIYQADERNSSIVGGPTYFSYPQTQYHPEAISMNATNTTGA